MVACSAWPGAGPLPSQQALGPDQKPKRGVPHASPSQVAGPRSAQNLPTHPRQLEASCAAVGFGGDAGWGLAMRIIHIVAYLYRGSMCL